MAVNQTGAFVPSNYIWDVAQLQQVDVNSPEFKELLIRLYQNINQISLVLNIKDTGVYSTSEYVNGQTYFANPNNTSASPVSPVQRAVIRKVINYTLPLPNAGTATIPHGINVNTAAANTFGTTFTRIYGVANDTVNGSYLPLPYAAPALAGNITLRVDPTNVYITTGNNRNSFTTTYIVLEYLPN
jgi:hypothetical protein